MTKFCLVCKSYYLSCNCANKRLERELKDNNDLRSIIMIYSNAIDKIEKLTKNGEYKLIPELDGIKSIITKVHEDILKS